MWYVIYLFSRSRNTWFINWLINNLMELIFRCFKNVWYLCIILKIHEIEHESLNKGLSAQFYTNYCSPILWTSLLLFMSMTDGPTLHHYKVKMSSQYETYNAVIGRWVQNCIKSKIVLYVINLLKLLVWLSSFANESSNWTTSNSSRINIMHWARCNG